MAKKRIAATSDDKKQSPWALPVVGIIILVFGAGVYVLTRTPATAPPSSEQIANNSTAPSVQAANPATPQNPSQLLSMEVAKAVMVTAELEFPGGVPTIATALSQIERRYQPDDGTGRTFAILDAYGEPTPDGKLHLSMHVSSERAGLGSLVFKRTGEVLWNSRILQTSKAATEKNLGIFLTDEAGASWVIDGSGRPKSILDARVRDKGIFVRDFWPDGAQREATFIYSACGCPVKVSVRRTGERTTRTSDQPVIFPDDPAAVQTIAQLMSW